MVKRRQALAELEMVPCTFHPLLDPHSLTLVAAKVSATRCATSRFVSVTRVLPFPHARLCWTVIWLRYNQISDLTQIANFGSSMSAFTSAVGQMLTCAALCHLLANTVPMP